MNKTEFEYQKQLLNNLQTKYTTYQAMIDLCCGGVLILNGALIEELTKKDYYFEMINNQNFEELEIFQYYIISEQGANNLSWYTNEIVFYNEELNLYFLGVTHYGTTWDYVGANWKSDKEFC